MVQAPTDSPHLNFAFAFVYCFLNSCFALFVALTAFQISKGNPTTRASSSRQIAPRHVGTPRAVIENSFGVRPDSATDGTKRMLQSIDGQRNVVSPILN
jgi:hypothetical protein